MEIFRGAFYPFTVLEDESFLKKCCLFFESIDIYAPNMVDLLLTPEWDRQHLEKEVKIYTDLLNKTKYLRDNGIIRIWEPQHPENTLNSIHGEELWWLLGKDEEISLEYKVRQTKRRLNAWSGFIRGSLDEGIIPFTNNELAHDILLKEFKSIFNDINFLTYRRKFELSQRYNTSYITLDAFNTFLPDFEMQSFEDVLAWRDLLKDSLDDFRHHIAKLAANIELAPWDEDYEKEILRVIKSEIEPSIQNLKMEANAFKYRNISHVLKTMISIKPLPFLATMFVGVPPEIAIALAGGAITLDTYFKIKEEKENFKKNGLSLLLKHPIN